MLLLCVLVRVRKLGKTPQDKKKRKKKKKITGKLADVDADDLPTEGSYIVSS